MTLVSRSQPLTPTGRESGEVQYIELSRRNAIIDCCT